MATRALTYKLVGEDKLSPVVNKAGKNAQSMSAVMGKSMRQAALAFAAVGVAASGVAIKMATDYQASMQKINGLVGISQKQVNSWSKQVLNLANNLPQSPKELADAMYYVTSAGLRGKTAFDALTVSARASAAGLGDTTTVADAVTSAMNAYGSKTMSARKATDILTAAIRDGKLEASSLAPVLGNVIPIASQMGVSFDQATAAIAAMSTTGMDAATASTSVQAILSGLLKPSTQGAAALKKVGLSYAGIRAEVREKGLFSALMDVKAAFRGNDAQLAQVIPNVRALRGFLSLTGAQAGSTKKIFDDLAHSTGSTDKAFQSASQTADFKLKSAMSSLQVAAINMGSAMLPAVAGIASAFSKLLTPIAKNKAAFATLAIGVTAFAVTAKTALTMFARGAQGALMTSVVGIAILGLTVAITALLTHWNQVWGAMRKVTSTVCSAITSAAKAVWNWLKSNWPYLLGILTGPFGLAAAWIFKHWNSVVSFFRGIPGKIRTAVGNVLGLLRQKGADMITGLLGGITGALRNIGGWIKDHIFNPIVNGIKSLFGIHSPSTVMAGIGGHLVSGLILGLIKSNPSQIIGKVFGGLPNALGALVGKGLVEIGKLPRKALDALVSVGSAIGGFIGPAFGSFGNVDKWLTTALAITHTPMSWLGLMKALVQRESGGNPRAVNPISVLGQHATGLLQTLPSTFAAYAIKGLGGIMDPVANAVASIRYIKAVYGTPAAIHGLVSAGPYGGGTYYGYDKGGVLKPGLTLAMNATGHDEYVVNPALGKKTGMVVNYNVTINPTPLARPADIGREVVGAIREFERGAGKSWRS